MTGRVQLSVQVVGMLRDLDNEDDVDASRLASGLSPTGQDLTTRRSISALSSADRGRHSSLEASGAMVLEVVVQKAEGLLAMDRGGTSDPFCELQLGKQKKKTKVKPKTLNPQWDETFLLDYSSSMTNLSVRPVSVRASACQSSES